MRTLPDTPEAESGLVVREVRASDRDAFAAMFERLSPQSRFRRYLSPKPALTQRELTYLTDVDHVRHVAVAAIAPGGDMIGVARYAAYPGERQVADVAVEVVDHFHRRGIGTLLVARVLQRAHANGFEVLRATTLWENRPARALMRRFGFRACGSDDGLLELQLPLDRA